VAHYLSTGDVLVIADEVLDDVALRDFGLLDSAVARPQSSMFGQDAYPDLREKAAALMHSIVANHPFVDGNKRVGLTAALAFLSLNGVATEPLDEDAAYDVTIAVASGELDDVMEIAKQLRRLAGS
jgi:death-on-curing protein